MFITKKWILLAVVEVPPFASECIILILKLPPAIVCIAQDSCALFVVFSSCIVTRITESAWTVLLVTVNSALVSFAKATAANVITPEVALIVTPVVWSVACVTVPLLVCTIPFAAPVITKLPVSTVTSCPSAAIVNPATAAVLV